MPSRARRRQAPAPTFAASQCRNRGRAARVFVAVACLLASSGQAVADAIADAASPGAVASLLNATPLPQALPSPDRRHLLLVHKRDLLSLERLAAPMVTLAGRNIDPRTLGQHAPTEYYALSLVEVATGTTTAIPLPRAATIGFPQWAPDGSRFAFAVTTTAATELWIGEPSEVRARRLLGRVNATSGQPCSWMPNSRQLLCRRVVAGGRAQPRFEQPESAARIDADPLAAFERPTSYAPRFVERLLESELELIDVVSAQRRTIGRPSAFERVEPAPSGAYLLVSRLVEPYPLVAGVDTPHRTIEIWDKTGRIVRTLPATRRAVQWHASQPATLAWVEHDGGHDRVFTQAPPFAAPAREIFGSEHRFAGLDWLERGNGALISVFDRAARVTEIWHADDAAAAPPRLVGGRALDRDSGLGLPIKTVNRFGKDVVAAGGGHIYLRGEESNGGEPRRFVDRVELVSGATTRLWQSSEGGYEAFVDLLSDDASLLLTRYERPDQFPNYYVNDVASGTAERLTAFEHPARELRGLRRVTLAYERADGYPLSSTLYLPAEPAGGGPLPLILWAYPRQVGSGYAPPAHVSHERFLDFNKSFKLFFLLRGYAVLDDVAMPVVGDTRDANDTFIEQIVANAEAAIAAAGRTGLVDSKKAGVAGHSYGAFMVANLLVHSQLFKAGVAMSGAYNRTLTPFGFQTERRTLWEAPETYLAMSPFLYSNRIAAPLLLVHGMLDTNAGTPPVQSTQFYEAIRGNGGEAELLLLPWEGHSYRARESISRISSAMLDWFDRYLKQPEAPPTFAQAQLTLHNLR
jgi:dipeptidyl aminopeptidase/acylaminoacyl peptidase